MSSNINHPIVLFDGVCNFCNSMINFAMRNDAKGVLRFAPLQSATGEQLRAEYNIPASIDSIIVIENNRAYTHADAALRITRHLRFPVKLLYVLSIVPAFISKPVYNWVARNRYKWFGKKEACMIPTPQMRSRFLD